MAGVELAQQRPYALPALGAEPLWRWDRGAGQGGAVPENSGRHRPPPPRNPIDDGASAARFPCPAACSRHRDLGGLYVSQPGAGGAPGAGGLLLGLGLQQA